MKTLTSALLPIGFVLAASFAVSNQLQEPADVRQIGPVEDIGPTGAVDVSASFAAAEIARIQAHLLRAEQELREADVSHLSQRQLANRRQHIAVLRRYRERGSFPHNHVATDRTPVFIDPHGTHCAVGYLMAVSGRSELASRIAATRNLARVPELADMPDVVAWLETAGLSTDEAARIQPAYGPPPVEPRARNRYETKTFVAAGLGSAAVAWNLLSNRTGEGWWLPGAFGVGLGVVEGALALDGVAKAHEDEDIPGALIGVNAAVGLLSGVLGTRTLVLGRKNLPATGNDTGTGAREATLTVTPWTAARGSAGVQLAFRF